MDYESKIRTEEPGGQGFSPVGAKAPTPYVLLLLLAAFCLLLSSAVVLAQTSSSGSGTSSSSGSSSSRVCGGGPPYCAQSDRVVRAESTLPGSLNPPEIGRAHV